MTKSLARERGPVKPRLLGVDDKARTLGMGVSFVYSLIARGELDAVKVGDRSFVPVEAIDKFIASRPKAKIKPPRASRKRRLG